MRAAAEIQLHGWLCGCVNAGVLGLRRLSHPVVYRTRFSTIGAHFGLSINGLENVITVGSGSLVGRLAAVGCCASHLDQNGRHRYALWWGWHRRRRFAWWWPWTWTFLQQEDFPSAELLSSLHRHAVGSYRTRLSVRRLVQSTCHPFRPRSVDRQFPGDH